MSDQKHASNPEISVFVSANAGTGKTKVLIERVLRLLLKGERPETILCVTFTNAAAAEIEERLHRDLANWAVCEPDELMASLQELTSKVPRQADLERARRLFAEIIDNDAGPRIDTTHSFCQSLLSRFPVEAGVPPHFQLISDAQSAQLLHEAFASLFYRPNAPIQKALDDLIAIADSQILFGHIKEFINFRELSDAACLQSLGIVPAFDKALKSLSPHQIEDLPSLAKACADDIAQMPISDLLRAGEERVQKLAVWLSFDHDQRAEMLDVVASVVLTKAGDVGKRILLKKQIEAYPDALDIAHRIADRLIAYYRSVNACLTAHRSRQLYLLGQAAALHYRAAKMRAAVLDYNDLIIKAGALLSASEMMAWVRWKLDYGINHMLIDEAQDTNPAQWRLLSAIADEFFAQEASQKTDDERNRTLFSVGDFKQSIYSFQGANPFIFKQKGSDFSEQAIKGGHQFDMVSLAKSYRSSKAVLDFVNQVMAPKAQSDLGGVFDSHEAAFEDKFGHVEIWPITDKTETAEPLPYFDVPDMVQGGADATLGPDGLLAEQVADHIESLIKGEAPYLDGRSYQPRDIMILVRKRDRFFALLRSALVRRDIPVAGADRLYLSRQIEINDLCALGDVCLVHDDDLQLACLLKSPLFGLSDDELMALAIKRPEGMSLYNALRAHSTEPSVYGDAIAQLHHYFDLALRLSPAAFFETILVKGGRDAFYKRLGTDVDESLNAFIRQAYDFEAEGGVSLADYLSFSRAQGGEIKRDLGNMSENEVRIMTIHGAKGLQAPVVYLPDTVAGIDPSAKLIQTDTALFWPPDSTYLPDDLQQHKDKNADKIAAEHQRLLYVALTRAAECLFIAGWDKARKSSRNENWYDQMVTAMAELEIEPDSNQIYRLTHQGVSASMPPVAKRFDGLSAGDDITARYPWAFQAPSPEAPPIRPLVPSAPIDKEKAEPFSSPAGQIARQEGLFMHHLLEELSAIADDRRIAAADRITQNSKGLYPALSSERMTDISHHILSFMKDDDFTALFNPDALVEFPVSGLIGNRPVIGQIDRLVITDDFIWLVDFKSGRPQTQHPPQDYILQMALYSHIISTIYPDKPLRTEIIWLTDLSVSHITDDMMAQALADAGIQSFAPQHLDH